VQEAELAGQAARQEQSDLRDIPGGSGPSKTADAASPRSTSLATESSATSNSAVPPPITGCTIWIGSTAEDEAPSRVENIDEMNLATKDGIGVVYIPQLANEKVLPEFNPFSVSTFRFELSKEESEKLVKLGEANFQGGSEKIVSLLRIMWQRKRKARLKRLMLERLSRPFPQAWE